MKTFACILLCLVTLAGPRTTAQTMTIHGSTLTVSSAILVDLRGNAQVRSSGAQNGRLALSGTVEVQGNWTHDGTGSGFTAPASGTVRFRGTEAQSITGTGTPVFPNLAVDNPAGLLLGTDIGVQDALQLQRGRVTLGDRDLWLGPLASISGSFNAGTMIQADSSGMVKKEMTGSGIMLFPVGDGTDSVEYSPATLTFTAGTYAPGAWVGVRVKNAKHPGNPLASGPYLNRYWTLEQNGITGFSCDAVFTYLDTDVVGSEAGLFGARYHSLWSPGLVADPVANTITFTGLTAFSDFSGMSEWAASATLAIRARAFLQGGWNGTGMNAWLNNSDSSLVLLPRTQPYSDPQVWNYQGTENVAGTSFFTAHPDIVDWVLVELRSGDPLNPPMTVEERRAGFIMTDGSIMDLDGMSPLTFSTASSGSYYVVIRHRNHLAVMSAAPRSLTLTPTLVDFTAGQEEAFSFNTYPDAMKDLGEGHSALFAGDCNGDGFIDLNDFTDADNYQSLFGFILFDANLDGYIDLNDFTDADNNQGLGIQFP